MLIFLLKNFCTKKKFLKIILIKMSFENIKIGFIGFGHMARILCEAFLRTKQARPNQIFFSRRNREKAHSVAKEMEITPANSSKILDHCDVIIFCVRPQNITELLEKLKKNISEKKIVVSILAGTKIHFFEKYFGNNIQVARVMPNMGVKVAAGMSVVSFNQKINIENQILVNLFFSSFGSVVEIPEKMMDIACGISGSGIGFVYKLIEAFIHIGEKTGLSYEQALKMTTQTFLGAAKLIQKEKDIKKLVEEISTEGGTTEAGFIEFEYQEITKKIQKVILQSSKKSKELSD